MPSGRPTDRGPISAAECLVIVPAYNEADSVGAVVREVLAEGYPVLVVDDGSGDATTAVAEQAGADVVRIPANVGVGAALQSGFRFAVAHGYSVVVQCDGDGQHRPREISTLLACMEETQAHLAIGTRFHDTAARQALPWARRTAMRVLAAVASRRAGVRLSDASSGFRAIRSPLLDEFARDYPAEYLGDTVEAIILAGRAGYLVRDVQVGMDPRRTGSPSASTVRATWYVLRVLAAILLGAGSRERGRGRGTSPRVLTTGRPE
jgi:glycosyltransferase involved in cell wall biosynthesis